MTLLQFFRIFNRNLNLFLLCSIVMALMVFFLTRNLPEEFESSTELYTGIASGVELDNITNNRVDYFATNTEYDNLINIIKSRQTLEEVGYRLLTQHLLLDTLNKRYLNSKSWNTLKFYIPDSLRKELLVPYSVELTIRNLKRYRNKYYSENKVKWLFEGDGSPYSYKSIGRISIERVQSSDLLNISYTYNDPGIVQNTLMIVNQVASSNVEKIKLGQSDDVVEYFREQVNLADKRLDAVEQKLQDFRVANKVINYEEQTRSLAQKKEIMEDEYQKELARKEAAEAGLQTLNQQLAMNSVMVQLGSEILEKKRELIDLRAKVAELETYYNDMDLLQKLRVKADKLEAEISNKIQNRYMRGRTVDGIPIDNLIGEWINYTLQLDETQARLKVYANRKKYFEEQYNQFAALGAKAARLEREIAVEESNYFEVLNSFNQALLKQKSQKLSSGGLVVLVPPSFPLEPKPSKAMLLILVAAIVGFVVPFAFVILKEFLDASIRTPERAEKLTGLKLMGAYPNLNSTAVTKNVDFDWLHEKAAGLLSQNLRTEARNRGVSLEKPKLALVFSTRAGDGKLLATHVLSNELVSLNYRVLVLGPKKFLEEETPFYDYVQYQNDKRFVNSENLTEIIPMGYDPTLYDYIFLIVDGVLTNPYPISLMEQFPMSICVVGAFRNWNRADTSALQDIEETLGYKPRLLLNGVEPDFMQNVLGDIEKSRSAIRRFFKKLLTLQLRNPRMKSRS